jgi:hypothetical protein
MFRSHRTYLRRRGRDKRAKNASEWAADGAAGSHCSGGTVNRLLRHALILISQKIF